MELPSSSKVPFRGQSLMQSIIIQKLVDAFSVHCISELTEQTIFDSLLCWGPELFGHLSNLSKTSLDFLNVDARLFERGEVAAAFSDGPVK